MRGDALAAMKHLDRAGRDPRPHRLAQQCVRHRVVVLLDLDVIVEAGAAFLPFGVSVGLRRQLFERRPLQVIEQRAPARPQMPRHTVVERRHQLGDGGVQLAEREEAAIAQFGDDPARRHLHGDFHLRLGESRQMQMVWKRRHTQRSVSRTLFIPTTVASLN